MIMLRPLLLALIPALNWCSDAATAATSMGLGPIPLWFTNPPPWLEDELPFDGAFVAAHVEDIHMAMAHYIGDSYIISRLLSEHPDHATLREAQITSQVRYLPGFQEMDRILSDDRNYAVQHQGFMKKIQESLTPRPSATAPVDMDMVARVYSKRNRDGFPMDAHRMLMAFDPANNNAPELEMKAGLNRRLDTRQFPGLRDERTLIIVPASWKHVVSGDQRVPVMFTDARDQFVLNIGIRFDPAIIEADSHDGIVALSAWIARTPNERHGYTVVGGKTAAWTFSRGRIGKGDPMIFTRRLVVFVPLRGRMYTLMFSALSTRSDENADHRMARLQPLAHAMLTGVAFEVPDNQTSRP
jgi:hypothetical protein